MSDTEFEDYSGADGFVGWIRRDPLFRVCILTETTIWVVLSIISSCFFCVILRKCLREKTQNYSLASDDAYELKERGDSKKNRYADASRVKVGDAGVVESRRRARVCLKYRHFWTILVSLALGFVSMVVLMVVAVPFVMPHALFIPNGCNGTECRRVPGAKNLFIVTESGNNVSLRLFPANKSGKFYSKRFSLMYSNPNAGYTTDSYQYQVYAKLALFGISVYAWDYPGYMLSTGSPNYTSVMEAGEAVLRFVAAHSIKQPEDVILSGRSLGGAVSIALAQTFRSKALVLLNPLDSLQSLLGDCCVLSGWASGLNYADGHFDAFTSLSQFRGCLFQYAAEEDAIVYFQRQRKLFFEYSDKKRKQCSVFVKGKCAGHNDDQWEKDSFVKALNLYFQKLNI